jgi:hypothetical protein
MQMQILHLYCLPLQLSFSASGPICRFGSDPIERRLKMRMLEMVIVGIIAVGAQLLVVGAVLI